MVAREDEVAEVARWCEGIERVHECIARRFRRPEPRRRALDYLKGLLSPVERKNGWQLASRPVNPLWCTAPAVHVHLGRGLGCDAGTMLESGRRQHWWWTRLGF